MATRTRAVDEYLRELERLLRDVPSDRRNEIVTDIEAHIDALLAEHGPSPSDADVRNVLERVGRPDDIAREARDETDAAPVRRRWTDIAAVVALPFPFIGWIVGAVLLWMSELWSTRDKLIGTLAGPGMFVLGALGTVAIPSNSTVLDPDTGGSETAGGGPESGQFEVLVTVAVLLVPVVVALYLARKLRTESDGRSSGPGRTHVGEVSAIALLLLILVLGAGAIWP